MSRAIGMWGVAGLLLLGSSPASAQSSFAAGTSLDWPGVLTGAFLGFLLLTGAYNLVFFAILRERLLLWQAARVILLVGLTVSLSSLPLGPWLRGDGTARQILINLLFDGSIAMIGLFLGALLGPAMTGATLHRMLRWQPVMVATTTPAMLLSACPPLYMAYRNAVLLGILALLCAALAQAIRRGSRTACLQAAAWTGVLTVCGISLFHDIVLGRPFGLFLYALFTALAIEMLLSTVEAGDRFMRLKREHDEARTLATVLDRMARTDPLTGLYNRRGLEAQFVQHRPKALAILDIDHFKQINDRFGHERGDAVLTAAAAALASGEAFAARIGGEEFALLFYGDRAAAEAEILRSLIPERVARDVPDVDRSVTASAGLVPVTPDMDFAGALRAADLRLYSAKTAGRDRLIGVCDDPPVSGAAASAATSATARTGLVPAGDATDYPRSHTGRDRRRQRI
ncbi:GGDEF domain-containing protein [Methylobacterium sp. J-078]|uniref:GGDEF domain-containing protein n=1 Tax=Methylobacterium sp. J-078 TaxID=2836657 RepID=UPI001FBB30C3|nr:GGDEF domain-containing protein [Methylobacterium sp. J-078]MCJ2047363.1 GGDEF domain-containing protein [Methylobacterium sp. J-078]